MREAKAAFSDERVLLERFIERPRHIEVQVALPSHCVSLFHHCPSSLCCVPQLPVPHCHISAYMHVSFALSWAETLGFQAQA